MFTAEMMATEAERDDSGSSFEEIADLIEEVL